MCDVLSRQGVLSRWQLPPVLVTVTSDKVLSGSAGGRVWAWPPIENHERTLALLPTGEQDPKWGCGGTREGRQ